MSTPTKTQIVKDSVLYFRMDALSKEVVLLNGKNDSLNTQLTAIKEKQKEVEISKEYFGYTLTAYSVIISLVVTIVVGAIALITWKVFTNYTDRKTKELDEKHFNGKEELKVLVDDSKISIDILNFNVHRTIYLLQIKEKNYGEGLDWGLLGYAILITTKKGYTADEKENFRKSLLEWLEADVKVLTKGQLTKKIYDKIVDHITIILKVETGDERRRVEDLKEKVNAIYYSK